MAGNKETPRERIERFKLRLIKELPADGASIGNITIRNKVGLGNTKKERDYYWKIRDELEAEGQLEIVPAGGKGGSVRRVPPVTEDVPPEKNRSNSTKAFPKEASLYKPMLRQIEDGWAKAMGMNFLVVEQTSHSGVGTGGRWTRPDIAALSVTTFPYLPEIRVDVVTFEVKHHSNSREFRLGIYEALAHSRRATQSFLLLYVPRTKASRLTETVDEICREAGEVGIGVIIAEKPDKYETWETRVPARRRNPNPEQLNRFLAGQLSAAARERLKKRLARSPEFPDETMRDESPDI